MKRTLEALLAKGKPICITTSQDFEGTDCMGQPPRIKAAEWSHLESMRQVLLKPLEKPEGSELSKCQKSVCELHTVQVRFCFVNVPDSSLLEYGNILFIFDFPGAHS